MTDSREARMSSLTTFLAPGQRYMPRQDAKVFRDGFIVVDVDRFRPELTRVTCCGVDGRNFAVWAVNVEAAIASGELSPIVGIGRITLC
jgi:hypothetical protein